jgi:hypothetical protein
VRGPEDGIELIAIRLVQIQLQQQALHVRQQLIGFIEKGFVKLTQIYAGAHEHFLPGYGLEQQNKKHSPMA